MRSLLDLEVCRKFGTFLSRLYEAASGRQLARVARIGDGIVEPKEEPAAKQDDYDAAHAPSDMVWEGCPNYD